MSYRKTYLKAAERVASGYSEFSCMAISLGWNSSPERRLYRKTMGFERESYPDPFIDAIHATGMPQDFRVWLLCMMAACCDDMEVGE